jgi:hypothetical protein
MPPAPPPPKPYRFTQEQQARLDAHFGERAVWLPLPMDELVAALVEAQAREMGEAEADKAGFTNQATSTNLRVIPSVAYQDNETRPEEVSMSASPITVEATVAAVTKTWPEAELVEKKAYHRVALGKLTLGYAYLRQRPAFEVIKADGSGKYDYFGIKTKADLTRAINAMKAVEKRAAKKAAATAKKAS